MMGKLCAKFVVGRWVRWVRQRRREWEVLPREFERGFQSSVGGG
jgi:hypothetical protein